MVTRTPSPPARATRCAHCWRRWPASNPRRKPDDAGEARSDYARHGVTNSGAVIRWAWWGRTSTDDLQDPTLSLPRQLANCRGALPTGAVVVAHFFDVESGRKDLDVRGRGTAHEKFAIPIPRDGGIQDLLTEATRSDRRFEGVICESIDRIARRTYFGTKIEHELERVGVVLAAADEPIQTGHKRATTILTRRVKQSVAEWYAIEALEKSWDGFKEHTRQGFNVGRPPYGYRAEHIPHPVPARRDQGKSKTRLLPDPVRAPVVRHIYDLYLSTGFGLRQIRDALNADPARYPPPTPPDPARAIGKWSTASIWEILRNPKYTGHMVWNRRARKSAGNRTNPPSEWVWSPEPVHPPIVSLGEYQTVARRAASNARSRRSDPDGVDRPGRDYLYRGLVRCGLCGQRMSGNARGTGRRYYSCFVHKQQPSKIPPDHPPTVNLPEPNLHDALTNWLSHALFGPDRVDYWRQCLRKAKTNANKISIPERLAEIDTEIADLERRLNRQILNLETDDLTSTARTQIVARIGDLETAITARKDAAAVLRAEHDQRPQDIEDIESALQRLPELGEQLRDLPQRTVRRLYDALDLRISYDPADRTLDIELTLTAAIGQITTMEDDQVRVCSVPP
ncbi:recombinase family protein, partial [Virgisporangium ochraceum]|uniref:recombinase family protein n=1 Tax=Virgisporangium ochraceum TaxID=65505 RepID=UPI00194420CF